MKLLVQGTAGRAWQALFAIADDDDVIVYADRWDSVADWDAALLALAIDLWREARYTRVIENPADDLIPAETSPLWVPRAVREAANACSQEQRPYRPKPRPRRPRGSDLFGLGEYYRHDRPASPIPIPWGDDCAVDRLISEGKVPSDLLVRTGGRLLDADGKPVGFWDGYDYGPAFLYALARGLLRPTIAFLNPEDALRPPYCNPGGLRYFHRSNVLV